MIKTYNTMTSREKIAHIWTWAWHWAKHGTSFPIRYDTCALCGASEDNIIDGITIHHIFCPSGNTCIIMPMCSHHRLAEPVQVDCYTGEQFALKTALLWPFLYRLYRLFLWLIIFLRFVGFLSMGFWSWFLRSKGWL